ncbi:MAG: HAMP domain-containing protein, partial [Gammaproteobacteria bacterium]|nr:HAMP domain-containing protein [Gammaproteobacteria bacterium]
MAFRKIRLKPPLSLIVVVLFGAILASLHLMSNATQDSSQLGEIYSKLLLINTLGSILLLALVVANVVWLVKQLRRRAAGSALTARMVFLFLLLTLTPASIVFYYSMMFLQRSIDSWFDVRIDQAMDDALKLGQAAIDERIRAVVKQTEQGAKQLEQASLSEMALLLDEIRGASEESDLTVFSKQGRIIASSSPQPSLMIPDLPDAVVLLQVKPGKTFTALEPGPGGHLQVRALASLADDSAYFLQAVHPLPLRLSQLAETVESAYIQIKELGFLRNSLKQSFSLTLSLVLLLSLLAAIWVAFISIRRLVAPVRHLAQGTRAVAEGRYEQRLPVKQRDELGFLVESFNTMTASLSQARDEAHRSRMEVERQRAYLETVLANLSSGVLSFDAKLRILTANHATDSILHATLSRSVGLSMSAIEVRHPHLADLLRVVEKHLSATRSGVWQEDVTLPGPHGNQELLCRGTHLFRPDGAWQGAVLVLDDVTALLQAQRQAAWSEVARRLAHEIKNPLTPIQLSAERLKLKLGPTLGEAEASFLERSTRTIVQQVEAMKTMVNAFAEYARPAVAQMQRVELNGLIEEVVA